MGISQYLGFITSGQGDICRVFICPQIFEFLYWRRFQICKSVNVRVHFSFSTLNLQSSILITYASFESFSVLLHSTHAYDWHIKTDINLIRLKTNWIGCNRVNKLLMTTSTSVWSPHSINVGAIDAMITVENAFPTLAIYSQCQDTNYIYFES